MFPLRDENPTELTPVVTYIIIAFNVAAWLLVQQGGAGEGFLQSLCTFGSIPADITGGLQTWSDSSSWHQSLFARSEDWVG